MSTERKQGLESIGMKIAAVFLAGGAACGWAVMIYEIVKAAHS